MGADRSPAAAGPTPATEQDPFGRLHQRPVAEHVAVYEAEHDRLQRRLGGIDQI